MKVYTIGFTQKSAARFFGLLRESGAQRVVDVRLRNTSGLAGFAKKNDLAWFLRELCAMDYAHRPGLVPTGEMLDAYRKRQMTWDDYETRFLALMEQRAVQDAVPPDLIANACLLCSEDKPERCHRRLVAEYLNRHWGGIEIVHLG